MEQRTARIFEFSIHDFLQHLMKQFAHTWARLHIQGDKIVSTDGQVFYGEDRGRMKDFVVPMPKISRDGCPFDRCVQSFFKVIHEIKELRSV